MAKKGGEGGKRRGAGGEGPWGGERGRGEGGGGQGQEHTLALACPGQEEGRNLSCMIARKEKGDTGLASAVSRYLPQRLLDRVC